jgi:hypothetical protein
MASSVFSRIIFGIGVALIVAALASIYVTSIAAQSQQSQGAASFSSSQAGGGGGGQQNSGGGQQQSANTGQQAGGGGGGGNQQQGGGGSTNAEGVSYRQHAMAIKVLPSSQSTETGMEPQNKDNWILHIMTFSAQDPARRLP